jgi:ribosome biogenesis GTPase A
VNDGIEIEFPRRPPHDGMTDALELHDREEEAFKVWLDSIYRDYKREELNQFEHNLNVWRQLWRAIELSNIAVIAADVRNPLLFIPRTLYNYLVDELKIPVLITLTKCDLIPKDLAFAWRRYIQYTFSKANVMCFATKMSIGDESRIGKRKKALHSRIASDDTASKHADLLLASASMHARRFYKVADGDNSFKLKMCLIGQPNAGKSSIVNALMGEKRVSVSRIAGHTKHLQTLMLPDGIICDSPGLLFPSVVVPQPVQELFGIFPFPQIRETLSAIRIVGQYVNLPLQLDLKHPDGANNKRKKKPGKFDSIEEFDADPVWTPWDICDAYAEKRGYFVKHSGRPDTHRAGLELLRDCLDGVVPFWVVPSPIDDLEAKRAIEIKLNEEDALLQALLGESWLPDDDRASKVAKGVKPPASFMDTNAFDLIRGGSDESDEEDDEERIAYPRSAALVADDDSD